MGSRKKKISKAKQAKSKASHEKLANKAASKKHSKVRKQNKLKTKLRRFQPSEVEATKQQHAPRPVRAIVDGEEDEHDEINPLDEDDISFYGTPGQNVSFASTIKDSKSTTSKKRKKKPEDLSDTEDYERMPRKLFSATDSDNKKMILPIKTKNGMVRERFTEAQQNEEPAVNGEDEEASSKSHDQPDSQSEMEAMPELTPLQLYALRQEKLKRRRGKIAMLCSAVTENPNDNMDKLKELIQVTDEKDADVCVTVRKLGMVSLLEVFKDIIPGYHVRQLTDKEKGQKMKKETLSVTNFEDTLIRCYKQYLQFLHNIVKGKLQGKVHLPQPAKEGLVELALKCLCDLVMEHSHFNFREDILSVVVDFMDSKVEKLSDMSCECVRKLFRGDKSGQVTLELTRLIGKMVKANMFSLQPKVLDTFLSLRIKEVSYTDPIAKREEEKKKANLEKLSRRDKKRKKYMALLEKDMKETQATEDKRKRLKLHTETIKALFLTYFRILKKAPGSNLLPSVLEGLAKYAHMISVDFFHDLFSVLSELIESESLSYRESLHCVQTAFTILTGQGSVLNIDPIMFYKHFYKSLFHVHSGDTSGDVPTVLKSLDVMISQRKRQVSQQRVLAFIKRLSIIALHQLPAGSVALLAALRSFFVTYKYADVLLDTEASGSGVYLPEVEDPEHCNAHNTQLWELNYLQHHYDPMVKRFAVHLAKGTPAQGDGQLNVELRKAPMSMYEMVEKKEIFHKDLPEKSTRRIRHWRKRRDFVQKDLQEDIEKIHGSVADVVT